LGLHFFCRLRIFLVRARFDRRAPGAPSERSPEVKHRGPGLSQISFPQVLHPTCLCVMQSLIPIYEADGSLYRRATEQQLGRLEALGLVARVVRHHKGHINRAILCVRPGKQPLPRGAYLGTPYSFREHLEHGLAWELKRLGGAYDGVSYAPPETRGIFLQVVADCLARP